MIIHNNSYTMFSCIRDIIRYYVGAVMIKEKVVVDIDVIVCKLVGTMLEDIRETYGFDDLATYKFSSFEMLRLIEDDTYVTGTKCLEIRKYMLGIYTLAILVDEEELRNWLIDSFPDLDCDEEGLGLLRILCSYIISDIAISCGEVLKRRKRRNYVNNKLLQTALDDDRMVYLEM